MEISRSGSFTQAANKFYITQPAISRIVKSLEAELETELFHRSKKHLQLTEAGKVLFRHGEIIERQYESFQLELDNLKVLKKGHITIGLPSIINSSFFSELIASFHKEYPEITFQLMEDGSKLIEEKVLDSQVDFGVVVLPTLNSGLECYPFVKEGLRLVVPSGHHLSGRKKVSLAELKDESFIMFNQDFALRDKIFAACREAGYEPAVISETSQLDFIGEMVASNVGITLLPESNCKGLPMDVQEIEVSSPGLDWDLAIIWKRDGYLSRVKKEFIRFAEEKLFL